PRPGGPALLGQPVSVVLGAYVEELCDCCLAEEPPSDLAWVRPCRIRGSSQSRGDPLAGKVGILIIRCNQQSPKHPSTFAPDMGVRCAGEAHPLVVVPRLA